MGSFRRGVLSPLSLPPRTSTFLRRLRHPFSRGGQANGVVAIEPQDPLLAAGLLLREARESHSLGLRQLAQETRISTAVLEALERGWRDRLPEPAYLRTMLPLLERHLDLADGSLQGALPPERERFHGPRRGSLLRRFTPGSIDVFTSWQGTLLYGLLTLALLYGLNLQQRRLAARGLLSTRPIPPLPADTGNGPGGGAADALLKAHPELRPLERAAGGQALARLRRESGGRRPDLSLGVLRLKLDRPTRVELGSPRGGDTRLDGVTGELALPVLPPFRLTLSPGPEEGRVLWKGRPLQPEPRTTQPEAGDADAGADYRYPAAVPASVPPSVAPPSAGALP